MKSFDDTDCCLERTDYEIDHLIPFAWAARMTPRTGDEADRKYLLW
jgi:hypothetical protein